MCLVLLGVPPDAGQSPRVPAVDTIDHTISPCCLDGGDHSERLLGTSEVETMGVRLLCVHTAAGLGKNKGRLTRWQQLRSCTLAVTRLTPTPALFGGERGR